MPFRTEVLETRVLPAAVIIDDGDSGFTTTGTWTPQTSSSAYNGDFQASWALGDTAKWNYTAAIANQSYRVSAIWPRSSQGDPTGSWRIKDGQGNVIASGSNANEFAGAVVWTELGVVTSLYTGLAVEFFVDTAGKAIHADAVKFEPYPPDISVSQGATQLSSGGSFSFGTTPSGITAPKVFKITNTGTGDLTLQRATLTGDSPFSISGNIPYNTVLAPNQWINVTVSLTSSMSGNYSAILNIPSDDPDENPFSFTMTGTVSPAAMTVTQNGTSVADGGSVNFGTTAAGTSVSKTFTINNPSSGYLTVIPVTKTGNFTISPNIASPSQTVNVGGSTTFTVTMNANLPGAQFGELVVASSDPAIPPIHINVSGFVTPTQQEIDVNQGTIQIADGTSFDFGSTPRGIGPTKVFTVKNSGPTTLTLQPVTLTGSVSPFAITSNFSANQQLAPDATATFSIVLNSGTSGSYFAVVNIPNNDPNESPFDFTITGVVTPPVMEVKRGATILADGDTVDFGTTGTTPLTRTFTISNPSSGYLTVYPVTATGNFTISPNVSSPSLIISPGGSTTITVTMNADQQGGQVGQLVFSNSDPAVAPVHVNVVGYVLTTTKEIDVSQGTTRIGDGQSFDFGSTPRGVGTTRVLTVRNSGTSTLTLQPVTLLGDAPFTIISNFTPNQQLAAGDYVTFSIQLNADVSGTYSAFVNIPSDDANENPFNFRISATVSAPQVQVDYNQYLSLESGDWFDFGQWSGPVEQGFFFIRNPSDGYLSINSVTTTGNFDVTMNLPSSPYTIPPNGFVPIKVTMNANLPGAQVGSFVITSSDPGVSPYTVNLSGAITATQQEVDVTQGTTPIGDGGAFDFGSTFGGTSVTKVFTVTNSGTSPLTVQPIALSGGGNFMIVTNFSANQQIAAGASASFSVRLNSGWMGLQTSTVSFASNDANENPFNFTVTGTVVPPDIAVSSNGVSIPDGGFLNMGSTAQGTTLSRTITISNPTAAYLTVYPASVTGNFTITSNLTSPYQLIAPWGTATFTIQMTATTAGQQSGTVSFATSDPDATTFDFTVYGAGTVAPVEVDVTQGSTLVVDGGSFDFGVTVPVAAILKTFTVTNSSTTNTLTVQPVSLTGTGNFSIASNFSANQQIAPGASATFSVWLHTGTVGLQTATLSFTNNDSNENPFNFTITGTVNPPEISVSMDGLNVPDGGSASFGTTQYGSVVAKTFWVTNPSSATLVVAPISVTGGFSVFSNFGSPYIYIPAHESAAFTVLMNNVPGDYSGIVTFATNDPDEATFNFTISGRVEGGEVSVTQGATSIVDGGSFNFGLTNAGTPISKTFRITNTSNTGQPLALQPITLPAGFTLTTSNFTANQQVAAAGPNNFIEFTVQLDGNTSGTISGTLSFGTSDSDENPFNFTISGSVNHAPTAVALNGAPSSLAENLSTSGGDVLVATVAITDDGFGTNNVTLSGADSSLFKIGVNGNLYLKQGVILDTETNPVLNVTVNVDDPALGANPDVWASLAINVSDIDEYDVTAIADVDSSANAVNENASNGAVVGITASASDADATTNTITYSLDNNAGGRFAISSTTGVVTVANGALLDRESASSHGITVRATSADGSFTTQAFTISINDVDEFDVTAISDVNSAPDAVNENSPAGTLVGLTASASDGDATNNAVTYSLLDDAGGRFVIHSSTGVVTVASGAVLDHESIASHDIIVRAQSADGSISTRTFTIAVNDVNEPVGPIADTNAAAQSVDEGVANGTFVGITAHAVDADSTNNTITYSLDDSAGGRFQIDPSTGDVTVADGSLIDREAASSYGITVRATSADSSWVQRVFTIAVNDVDEHDVTPITDNNPAPNSVPENSSIGTTVGITAFSNDADATNSSVSYSLLDDAGGRFAINASTGVVTVAGSLDREAAATHSITVVAASSDGSSVQESYAITVTDVDEFDVTAIADADPNSSAVNENAANGTTVGITASASDADATNNTITYSLLNSAGGRFAIDSTTGILTVANGSLLDRETAASYIITVQAASSDGSTSTQNYTMTINDVDEYDVGSISDGNGAADSVAENASPGTSVGLTASATDGDATNNTVTYELLDDAGGRFAINTSTGAVTVGGTAIDREAAASYPITVRATSADGSTSTHTFTIAILDEDETPISAVTDVVGVPGGAVLENSPNGTLVGITASATDPDATAIITYSLTDNAGGRFQINSSTGVVSVANGALLDRELNSSHLITVLATSTDALGRTTTSSQTFTIAIDDVVGSPTFALKEGSTTITSGTNLDFGSQLISAGTTSRTFTIRNTGEGDLTLSSLSFTTGGGGFTIVPSLALPHVVTPSQEFQFTVQFDPSAVTTYSGTITIVHDATLNSPFTLNVTGQGVDVAPEIVVGFNPGASDFQSGGLVNFGSFVEDVNATTDRTIYVTNTGTASLNLTLGTLLAGSGFSITGGLIPSTPFTLGVNQSVSFTVTFDEGTVAGSGPFNETLSITSDDPNENPFELELRASILPAGDVIYLDDNLPDSVFSLNGPTQSHNTGTGYGSDYSLITGTGTAEWAATITPGFYRVSASWPDALQRKSSGHPDSGKVANAAFTVFDNGVAIATPVLNQASAANDFAEAGTGWEELGVFDLSSGVFAIQLHGNDDFGNSNSQFLLADGIRLERIDVASDEFTLPTGRASYRLDVLANDPIISLRRQDPDDIAATDWTIEIPFGSEPSNGSATVESDGTITYRPTIANAAISDSFSYLLTNSSGTTRTVTVNLSSSAAQTILNDDTFSTSHGRSITFDVTANDVDPNGNAIVPNVTSVQDGWISGNAVYGSTFFIQRSSSGGFSVTFNWGTGDKIANVTSPSPQDLRDAIAALSGRPAGTITVEDLPSDDTVYRVVFTGDLATTPATITSSTATVVYQRGGWQPGSNGTFTYTPNKDYFKYSGEYTEVFRYTAGNQAQPALATLKVTNAAPTASSLPTIDVEFERDGSFTGLEPAQNRYYQIPINAFDDDGDALQIVLLDSDSSGTITGLQGFYDDKIVNGSLIYEATKVPVFGGLPISRPPYDPQPSESVTYTYRIFDGHSYSDVLVTTVAGRAVNPPAQGLAGSRFDKSNQTYTGNEFDRPQATLIHYGPLGIGDVNIRYHLQASSLANGFGDNSTSSFGDVAIDPATGEVTTSQELDLDVIPGTDSGIGLLYSSQSANPRPVIQGSIVRDAGGKTITELKIDLAWYALSTDASTNTVDYDEILARTAVNDITYTGTGDPNESQTYRFSIQSPQLPDSFNGQPLDGVLRWRVYVTATLSDGSTRPWVLEGDVFIPPRPDHTPTAPAPAAAGPFRGFGDGWSLSNVPYLQIFTNSTESAPNTDMGDGYRDWADDRVLLVMNNDARLFAPYGAEGQSENGGLHGWRAVSLNDRSDVPEEFGKLVRILNGSTISGYIYTSADGVKYRFGADGLLTTIEPLSGPATKFEYVSSGPATGSIWKISYLDQDIGGNYFSNLSLGVTEFFYDSNGWLASIQEPGGRTWSVAHDDTNHPTHLTGLSLPTHLPDSTVVTFSRTFAYDDAHLLTSTTHGSGGDTIFTGVTYNSATGLPTSVTLGSDVYGITSLAAIGLTDSSSFLTAADYKATIASPGGLDRLDSNLAPEAVPGHVRTEFTYDSLGRILTRKEYFDDNSAADTLLSEESWQRNSHGQVIRYTDSLGRATDYRYDYDAPRFLYGPQQDLPGRPASFNGIPQIVDPGTSENIVPPVIMGNVTSVFADYLQSHSEYNAAGFLIAVTDALGRVTRYKRDEKQRVIEASGPLGYHELWHYDFQFNQNMYVTDVLVFHIDDRGLRTDYEYDGFTRQLIATTQQSSSFSTTADLQVRTEFVYDANGNLDRTLVYNGNSTLISTTETSFDELNRSTLEVVTDSRAAYGNVSSQTWTYDTAGLLKTVIDGQGVVTTYDYNSRGLVTSVTSATGTAVQQITSTAYYPDGSIKTVTPPSGKVIAFFYDPATFKTWQRTSGVATTSGNSTNQVIETTTDAAGRVTGEKNRLTGAETAYAYDRQNRLVTQTQKDVVLDSSDPDGVDLTTSYTYDAVGNRLRIKSPRRANGDQVAADVVTDYNALNHVSRTEVLTTSNNGAIFDYETTPAGDVTKIVERRATPTLVNGVLTGYSRTNHTTTNDYDEFGRLIETVDPGPEAQATDRDTLYSYSRLGLTVAVTDRNGVVTVSESDAAGRVRKITNADGSVQTLTYNNRGELTEDLLEFSTTQTATSFRRTLDEYDALGRTIRVAKAASRIGTSNDDLVIETTYTDANPGQGAATAISVSNQSRRADLATAPVTKTYFDALGNVTRIEQPDAGDGNGSPVTRHEFVYSEANRTIDVYSFDALDRRSYSTTNVLGMTLREFAANAGSGGVYANPLTTSYAYDEALRPIRIDDEVTDRFVLYEYTDLATGKATKVTKTSPLLGTSAPGTEYRFDSSGNVVFQKDPDNNITLWTFDGLGRKTSETTTIDIVTTPGVDSGIDSTVTRTWTYNGLETVYKDRNGRATTMTVNPLNNSVREDWFTDESLAFRVNSIVTSYNPAGQLISALDYGAGDPGIDAPVSTVTFSIDQFGRVFDEFQKAFLFNFDAPTTRLHTTYDAQGTRNSLSANIDLTPLNGPSDEQVLTSTTYVNDALGRLTQISRDTGAAGAGVWASTTIAKPVSVKMEYEADSQLKKLYRFGSLDPTSSTDQEGFTRYIYDSTGRINIIQHKRGEFDQPIATLATTLNGRGQLSTETTQLYDSATTAGTILDQQLRYTYTGLSQLDLVEQYDGTQWNPVRIYSYQDNSNRQNGTLVKQNRLIVSNEEQDWQFAFDNEGNVTQTYYAIPILRDLTNELIWDHRGRLIEDRVHQDSDFSGDLTRKIVYRYDALDRLIGRDEYDYDASGNVEARFTTAYAYDGSSRLLEMDLQNSGKVTRDYVLGGNGEVLAIDETRSGQLPFTTWTFADATGSVVSIGVEDISGNWQIQHREFADFGAVPDSRLGDRNAVYPLDDVPVIWQGALREEFKGALHDVYLKDGRWFDPQVGRFLSEDPRGFASGQTNLYVLNGNDPYAKLATSSIDWSNLERPSAVDGWGQFSFGVWDAALFGHADDLFFNPLFGAGIAEASRGSAAYFAGLGVGVAGSILLGNAAGGALAAGTASGATYAAARSFQTYSVVGDVVGVYDSYQGIRHGDFGPLNLLGFAPALGLSRSAREMLGFGQRRAGLGIGSTANEQLAYRSLAENAPDLFPSDRAAFEWVREHVLNLSADNPTMFGATIDIDDHITLLRGERMPGDILGTWGIGHNPTVRQLDQEYKWSQLVNNNTQRMNVFLNAKTFKDKERLLGTVTHELSEVMKAKELFAEHGILTGHDIRSLFKTGHGPNTGRYHRAAMQVEFNAVHWLRSRA